MHHTRDTRITGTRVCTPMNERHIRRICISATITLAGLTRAQLSSRIITLWARALWSRHRNTLPPDLQVQSD